VRGKLGCFEDETKTAGLDEVVQSEMGSNMGTTPDRERWRWRRVWCG
jgi:hypothetical protein